MNQAISIDSRDFITSLARGLSVIETFDAEHTVMTLSDVARRAGISRAAARRNLLTLEALGYVARDRDRFRLTARVLRLGFAFLSGAPLWSVAEPMVERIAAETRESCTAAVLDLPDVVCVASAAGARLMSTALKPGTRLPVHATALGQVLLAGLPAEERARYLASGRLPGLTPRSVTSASVLETRVRETAERGYALVDQEMEEGVRAIAVPITDARNHTVGALDVSAHASRVSLADLRTRFLPMLRQAAREIGSALPQGKGA